MTFRVALATCLAVVPTLALTPAPAFAQEDDALRADKRVIVYAQETEIDFQGLDVEGELVRPTVGNVSVRRVGEFNPMIRIRTDFNAEIIDSLALME